MRHYWLEFGGRILELRPGTLLIGRSGTADLVLDDALVSRRHARIHADAWGASVEDCGSINGVFLNSRRITQREPLQDGDKIQIGTQVLVLRSALARPKEQQRDRRTVDTLLGERSVKPSASVLNIASESEATFSAHTLDLLGGVAEKILALGRAEEAEKVLTQTLQNILSGVLAGKTEQCPPPICEKAVYHAVKLAEGTGRGRWVDYAVELYTALGRPLPAPVVDQLYGVLRRVDVINLPALRGYVAVLRAMQRDFGPSERFVLQRLEGLERLFALK
ncbi:MAG TPA: FHA domain-containing protein [Polyangiaceae bacterium]|nr:FHA domain-containing protein [Polyangiaceae bacterium]